MKKIAVILISLTLFVSCSVSKSTGTITNENKSLYVIEKGTSFKDAIVINEKSERAGVNAEYIWIRKHYPGSKVEGQALVSNHKKPYDIIDIVTSSGEEKSIYFDISKFFGKF